ncbi:MAG: DUF4129 domain-containing protein [Anaerolineales bacterium]|nr:DUF4129 domain-containing protein [Anaerolineales bacterium]
MNSGEQPFQYTNLMASLRQAFWIELGIITLLVVDISWVIPWFRTYVPLGQLESFASLLALFIIFAVIATYLNKSLRGLGVPSIIYYALMLLLLLGMFSILMVMTVFDGLEISPSDALRVTLESFAGGLGRIPNSILVILTVIYLWWRGIVASAMGGLEQSSTHRRFQFGFFMFAIFALLHTEPQVDHLLKVLPIFFAAGLLAIALSRVRGLGLGKTVYHLPFTGRWFIAIAGITFFAIVLGTAGSSLLRSEPALKVAEIAGGTFVRFIQVIIALISPLFLWILPIAERMADTLMEAMSDAGVEGLSEQIDNNQFPDSEFEPSEPILEIPGELLIAAVVVIFLLLIFMIIRRARTRRRTRVQPIMDVGESIFEPDMLLSGVRRMLDQAQMGLDSVRKYGLGRRVRAATAIRRIYVQLLEFAAHYDRPRRPSETPREFQEYLSELFPGNTGELEIITEAYNQVRYGEYSEDEEFVLSVENAWKTFQRSIR